jgi:hypothetical protein
LEGLFGGSKLKEINSKKNIFLTLMIFSLLFLTTFSSGLKIDNICEGWEDKSFEYHTCKLNNGTLSGYVTDPLDNPIEGALIRVNFHETYEEDYSDENGYYYVDNIPICYCMKNCTCLKEGYNTEWVELGITENTTYDFMLYPWNIIPVLEGTQCNGWWISPITISFIYDPEEVAEIWYYYHGWHLYLEPFVVDEEYSTEIQVYSIDEGGNQSSHAIIMLEIDRIPPKTDLKWEVFKKTPFGNWWVRVILIAMDAWSDMSSELEIYINDVFQDTYIVTWPQVEFEWEITEALKQSIIGFYCYDNACNLAIEELDGSDIVSHNIITQKSYNIYFLRILTRFPNLQQFIDFLDTNF